MSGALNIGAASSASHLTALNLWPVMTKVKTVKSITLAGLTALLSPAAGMAAEAERKDEGWRCTIESIRNISTADRPPITEPERFFALAQLEKDGTLLTMQEATSGEHADGFITHTIDPATGRYAATTLLTDHFAGEQYVIESAGACVASGA